MTPAHNESEDAALPSLPEAHQKLGTVHGSLLVGVDCSEVLQTVDQRYPVFTADQMRSYALQAASSARMERAMHMTLCEFGKLLPRPNQLYIAVHIPGCAECDRMAAQQREAYGDSSPTVPASAIRSDPSKDQGGLEGAQP